MPKAPWKSHLEKASMLCFHLPSVLQHLHNDTTTLRSRNLLVNKDLIVEDLLSTRRIQTNWQPLPEAFIYIPLSFSYIRINKSSRKLDMFNIATVWRRILGEKKWPIHIKRLLHGHSARAFLVAQLVKNPPAMPETPVQFLGREDPLEKG